jgi:outer membrane protein TolC
MNRFLLLFAAASLIADPLAAQTSVRRVTIDDAVRIAMEKNSDLQAARFEVDRADARVQEAIGYALPAVDLTGRYTRSLKRPVFFLPDFANPGSGKIVPVQIGSNHSVDMTLNARQILFNGTVFVGMGAASIYADVARDLYRARQLETVTGVKRAFYRALLAREALDLTRTSLKNAEDNLKNVDLLRAQGVLSEYDHLRASVAVDNLRPAVIQAETNYALAVDGVRSAIGLDAHEAIEVVGQMQIEFVDDSLLVSAPQRFLETNHTYAALQKQVEVNEAFVMAERANYLPTISAFGNYQYQTAKNTFNISTNDFFASSQVGLQFSLSLFQGLQTNARVQQTQVDVRKSQEQLASVERNLRIGLTSTIGNLKAARLRIDAQERTVEQAERGYKIVTARFLSGAATQLEVNDAELALTQAKVNRIQAQFDYLVASAELDQYLGRLPASVASQDID